MARKVLFVTHDTSIYGASKSLQALIRSLPPEVGCAVVVRRPLCGGIDVAGLKAQFGVTDVRAEWLPFLDCFIGRVDPLPWRGWIWMALNNLLGRIGRRRIVTLAKQEAFDIVHLNSLVLAPLVTDGVPTVVHVRELWDGRYPALMRSRLEAAAGVVFIDQPVADPFATFALNHAMVLANPVLPGETAQLPPQKAWVAERIAGKLVLAIVGRLTEEKGAAFILACLRALPDPNLVFLMVGEGEMREACDAHARNDSRLICYGPESNMDAIYTIADIVVRAEDSPRIGRTVYEALYAGKAVALPGTPSAYPPELISVHRDRIFFYDARDVASFTNLMQRLLRQPPQAVASLNVPYDTAPMLRFWNACAHD